MTENQHTVLSDLQQIDGSSSLRASYSNILQQGRDALAHEAENLALPLHLIGQDQHTVLSDLQQIDGSSSLRASYSNILQQGRDALAHEAENLALPLHLIGQDQHTVLSDLQQVDGSSSLRASRFADMQQTFAVNANPANYRIDSVSSLETTADYHISSNESESFTGLSNANTATSQNPEIGEIIEGSPVVKLRKKKSAANCSSVLVKGPNSGEQLRELEVDGDEVLRSTKKTTDINETDLNASEKRNATQDEIEPEPVGKRIQNKFFTRTAALKSYNDQDETQNELIGMERSWVSNKIGPIKETKSNEEKFKFCQEVCRLSKLPPPLPLDIFEKIEWNYVKNFDTTKLTPGQKFQSATVLADIPRRHAKFLFCHPGPVVDTVSGTRDWFYADSIVQEIKLVTHKKPYYVVRWIGYEDTYNTVEPTQNLDGTAISTLINLVFN